VSGLQTRFTTATVALGWVLKDQMEDRIKESLIALLDGIKRGDGPVVASQMAALDGRLNESRGTLHPQLVHFLERRSYPKALLFLGGESDIPAGSCGGRP
jgi:hypothetical protein